MVKSDASPHLIQNKNIPNVRTIFKTKQAHLERFQCQDYFQNKTYTPRGNDKSGPVRDAQQTKQCVYSFPFDCGRCYVSEISGPLEVRIKEHKYNLI
jgi:hypothetical protein